MWQGADTHNESATDNYYYTMILWSLLSEISAVGHVSALADTRVCKASCR
jgi:hypothetical protein